MAGDGSGKPVVVGAQPAVASGDPTPVVEGTPVRARPVSARMQVRPRHTVMVPRDRMADLVAVLHATGGGAPVDEVLSRWIVERIDQEIGRLT